MNFYELVHTNFVFVCKTSNLFVQIRESLQHVMLQMACTIYMPWFTSCHQLNMTYELSWFFKNKSLTINP